MIDPINNFEIPEEWIQKANMPVEDLKMRIRSGCYVILSDGSLLKRGFTTGTTAAAAAKASVISLIKKSILEVTVPTPSGLRVHLQVRANNGKASAIKDQGDHASDATGGMEIAAEARECDRIIIKVGSGIGSKKGIPAINPSPMRQIEEAVKEAIAETGIKGAFVEISVPKGVEIAKKTLNAQVGITGGISILGTTGFVEPWNEHMGEMKEELIRYADRIVLTTGRLGVRFSHMLFPGYNVILVGSDISRGLSAAKEKADVIISGLPGLILKWSYPSILKDSGYLTVQDMIDVSPDNPFIDTALEKAVKLSGRRVVLFNRDGTILRDSEGDLL
jgi:cobalt-precorrin-5B (C1)-methyltransferase